MYCLDATTSKERWYAEKRSDGRSASQISREYELSITLPRSDEDSLKANTRASTLISQTIVGFVFKMRDGTVSCHTSTERC